MKFNQEATESAFHNVAAYVYDKVEPVGLQAWLLSSNVSSQQLYVIRLTTS